VGIPAEEGKVAAPIKVSWAIHSPVMIYFVLFTISQLLSVLTTGPLRNINTMYAARNEASWVGSGTFAPP